MANRRKVYGETGDGETGDGPKPCANCGCRHFEREGDAVRCRFCGQIVARKQPKPQPERAESADGATETA